MSVYVFIAYKHEKLVKEVETLYKMLRNIDIMR